MCGITGFLTTRSMENAGEIVQRMSDTLVHRGPDAGARWVDVDAGIALGHRRLSVLDLSPDGAQPMLSRTGRLVIAFNGEIYNWRELRVEIEDASPQGWRGHSDTEVLLAAIELWGTKGALERAVGMFAFACWDRQSRRLVLARDRLGEKPLYYSRTKGTVLFGSELKALRAHPLFSGDVDRDALALLLRHNYIPAPYSIYKDVQKLLPGTYLEMARDDETELRPVPYWTVRAAAEKGQRNPFPGTDAEAVEQLDLLLRRAVRQQMVADVPLGAFLSGGIDSSTIVAIMQAQSTVPVHTFTIGFHEGAYNEAQHAKSVARHLGTDHTELYVTPQQALEVIPRLPSLYDEPFADSSQIPTFLVSQLTRKHVTVSLSGDAGDELFAGYDRYVFTASVWKRLSSLPVSVRRLAAGAILGVAPRHLDRLVRSFSPVLPRRRLTTLNGDRLHKGAGVMTCSSVGELYHALVSHWPTPEQVVLGAHEPPTVLTTRSRQPEVLGEIERMMTLDLLTYLPDDILTKVDRAAMGVSLETRVPFLDHRVVEFAETLPIGLKLRDGVGKWVLRQVLYRYVPRAMLERPKQGFGVPIDSWLRGPLRDWAEGLLNEGRLRGEGYFDPEPVRRKWAEHLSGTRNWQSHLWNVLMFQAWLEEDGRAAHDASAES
jgi:asparagine synthase (glutamine-hydrolysing)